MRRTEKPAGPRSTAHDLDRGRPSKRALRTPSGGPCVQRDRGRRRPFFLTVPTHLGVMKLYVV